jgi:hypothetical protein
MNSIQEAMIAFQAALVDTYGQDAKDSIAWAVIGADRYIAERGQIGVARLFSTKSCAEQFRDDNQPGAEVVAIWKVRMDSAAEQGEAK